MTNHPYHNYTISKDNFFKNPNKVLELSKKIEYRKSAEYPGFRTDNLLHLNNDDAKNFAFFFAKKISEEVFPGIFKFLLDIRFHKYEIYDVEEVNTGWIHTDPAQLAGLVYLNPDENNFYNGTSVFIKNDNKEFPTEDITSRTNFNLSNIITDEYLYDLKNNHVNFTETIRFGNKYNRLIAYDSKLYHRPNNYNTSNKTSRTILVFFIDKYQYDLKNENKITSSWVDN